jgi:hypothetical protein
MAGHGIGSVIGVCLVILVVCPFVLIAGQVAYWIIYQFAWVIARLMGDPL